MSDYRHESRPRGRGNFGGRAQDRQMFDAICSDCGKNCKVPFRPTSGKPIYCSDCFDKVNGRQDNNSFKDRRPSNRDFGRREGNSDMPLKQLTEKIDVLNGKLDKIITLMSAKAEVKVETVKAKKVVKATKAEPKKTK